MKPCNNCQAVVDEYLLDKQLEPLRDLTVDDFSVCADCATIVDDACAKCGGAVYVPRSSSATPDVCPACRSDVIEQTGHDPGWQFDAASL